MTFGFSSYPWCEAVQYCTVIFDGRWFSLATISFGKPPRPRDWRRLRGIFLIARPPLLAVMQGGEFAHRRFPAHSVFLKPVENLAAFPIVAVLRLHSKGLPSLQTASHKADRSSDRLEEHTS